MKTIDLDELHLLDEAEVMGCPFHGVVEDATLTHPAGTLDHPQPTGGAVDVLQVPGWPDVGRTAEQLAADALLGHEWRNYALLSGSGAGRYVCGEVLPADAWIYFADTARGDRVPRPGFRLAPSLTATYDADGGELTGTIVIKRFGLLVAGGSTATQTVNISLSGIGQAAWNAGAEGNLTLALESQSRSGAKAMFGLWKDGVLVGLIEFAVTGTELGSLSVTPTVFKTRAEVLNASFVGVITQGQGAPSIVNDYFEFQCECINPAGLDPCVETTSHVEVSEEAFTYTETETWQHEFIGGVHYDGETPVVFSVAIEKTRTFDPSGGLSYSWTSGWSLTYNGVAPCDGVEPIDGEGSYTSSGSLEITGSIEIKANGVAVASASFSVTHTGEESGTFGPPGSFGTTDSSHSAETSITDWTGATYTRTPTGGSPASVDFISLSEIEAQEETYSNLADAHDVTIDPANVATLWSLAFATASACIFEAEVSALSDEEFCCFATRRLSPSVYALAQTIDSGAAVRVVATPSGANTLATALTGVTEFYYTTLRGAWQPETDVLEMRDGGADVSFV